MALEKHILTHNNDIPNLVIYSVRIYNGNIPTKEEGMHKYIIFHMLAAASILLISAAFSCTAPIIEDDNETNDVQREIRTVEAGSSHSLVLMNDGTVWAFGDNYHGQLGDGTTEGSLLPVRVMQGTEPMENVRAIAAGGRHSLFLKDDHTLWAAGYNNSQELQMPRNQVNSSISPVQIAEDVKSAAAGYEHTVILKNDGTVWTAGTNEYGQLGNGSTDTSHDFVQVLHEEGQPMSDVIAVAAGRFHTLILKNNGTLWAMGDNEYGQLGVGSDDSMLLLPLPVMGGEYDYTEMENIRTVAAGCDHTMIIKENGTVWMTGRICYGITDNGQGVHINSPNQVEDPEKYYEMMTNGSYAAAGSGHTLILLENGELWAKGWNNKGQLGDGTGISSTHPVRVTIP